MKVTPKIDLREFYNIGYVEKLNAQTLDKNKRLLKYINFKDTDIVIDYACGNGRLASLISHKIDKYIGVDFSEEFINVAQLLADNLKLKNVTFICDEIIEFSSSYYNKFNKAFALDFTEHIYDKDYTKIFSSIRETLKVGGILYIHTPNGDYFLEKLKKWGIMKQFPEHVAVRNDKENIVILEDAGFSKIEIKYIPHYIPFLKYFHFLSYLPLTGKFFRARLLIICNK